MKKQTMAIAVHWGLQVQSLQVQSMRILTDFIFLFLFFILLAVWMVGWLAFHVAAGGIHLLLVLAVVFLIIHIFRGGAAV
jgi:uncharacterized membrane protein (DUF485 family)